MNETKKLTESALLCSLFAIITIMAVGSGIGYSIYIDFIVPIFFAIVCIKCELKYTVLSGITSFFIVSLVLGNIGTSIWISQSIILGIMCGMFILKPTLIIDDIVYTSIIGVALMVFIDVYFSTLIGYSFIKEFQQYAQKLLYKEYIDIMYYMLIALFPLGTVFSIYFLTLLLGNKIHILKGNPKKKLSMIRNFKSLGRFICCSKKVFYTSLTYIISIEFIKILGINIDFVYLKTILISSQYICIYFVLRDSYISIQNYIISKYEKIVYARILTLITIISLVLIFEITSIVLVTLGVILDLKINTRIQQINIVNNYVDYLVKK
ncbi:MAG: DUF2232 domain-containing protein [Romboutsia sp.]